MSYDLIYKLLSDPQNRHSLAGAIDDFAQAHPGDPDLERLFSVREQISDGYYFMPLSPEQVALLEKVVAVNGLSRSAVRFSSIPPPLSPPPQLPFVTREANDNMREFLRHMPFRFTEELVIDFKETTGINLESVRRWGSQDNDGGFVEPNKHNLDKIIKVYDWLNTHALQRGRQVDFWDYLASIYPPVRQMLKESESTGNEIVVRVPNFMEHRSFDQFNYATFALDAHTAGLVPEIPETTRSSHIRPVRNGERAESDEANIVRPQWATLGNYAKYANEKAAGDEAHRQQMLNFLTLLRFLPILRDTVPALNIADLRLTTPDGKHPTRFTLRIIPEDASIQYISYGKNAKFSAQRWPFSEIASGFFDRMLSLLKDRISIFREFSSMLETAPDEIELLENKLQGLLTMHSSYGEALASRGFSSSFVTDEFVNEAKPFYRDLNRFFEQTLFHTHARGSVSVGNTSIHFEIVPEIAGVDISPVAQGRVSVVVEDITEKAAAESWTDETSENLFKLRVFIAWQIANGLLDPSALEDPQRIAEAAGRFGSGFDPKSLPMLADILVRLNNEAKERRIVRLDTSFLRAFRLKTIGTSHMQDYYVYDYSTPWQERMAQYYGQNHDAPQLNDDLQIVENYFKSVRHPHFIYNEAKLKAAITKTYEADDQRRLAFQRILDFFKAISIRTDSAPIHPLSADDASPESKAVEWAFQDYLALFPGAAEFEAEIEVNEALLAEVVGRQMAEHPGVRLRKGIIRRGVLAAINAFNEGRSEPFSQITSEFNPLPEQGIFPERFYDFVGMWGAEHNMTFFLDEKALLFAFSFLKNDGLSREGIDAALLQAGLHEGYLDINERILFDYLVKTRQEMEMFERLASPVRVEAYLNNNYSAPLISAEAASSIILKYLKGRLTSPYPVDLNALIVEEIGDRFDPYPSIKAEVVAFYHMLVREYLHDTYKGMMNAHDNAIRAIDERAADYLSDGGKMFYGKGFDLVEAATFAIRPALPDERREDDTQLALFGNKNSKFRTLTTEHPDADAILRFDSQLYLLAEALNEPPPAIGVEEHLNETYESIDEKVERMREQAKALVRQNEYELIGHIHAVDAFAQSVELFARRFRPSDSAESDIDNMDIVQIGLAAANIQRGLDIAAGLLSEIEPGSDGRRDGPILREKNEAVFLARRLGEDDETTELLNTAQETLNGVVRALEEQELLIQIRREEIDRAEARAQKDEKAMSAMAITTERMNEVKQIETDTVAVSEKIGDLREEISTYRDTQLTDAADSYDSYEAAWAKVQEFRNAADNLRRQLDALRARFDNISSDNVLGELTQIEGVSDEMRGKILAEKKIVIRGVADARAQLERGESLMAQIGGRISSVEARLVRAEETLPVPASITMPDGIDVSPSETAAIDNSIILFNVEGSPGRDPTNRLSQIKGRIGRLELLVVGDNAYVVNKSTADKVRGWLANRAVPLEINDIFGSAVSIDAGTHGIRIVNNSTDSDALLTFRIRLNILLSVGKSNEGDFIARLYEKAQHETVSPDAASLWRTLLAEVEGADILSENDARTFIRRFAITHGDEVESLDFAEDVTNNWYVEVRSPLKIELSDDLTASLETKPVEEIEKELGTVGWANAQKQQALTEARRTMNQTMKSLLTSSVRQWWVAHENEIPDAFVTAWVMAHQAHDRMLQRTLFAEGLASFLESRRLEGGGTLAIEPSEMLRYARQFVMENMTEIRLHSIIYEGDDLLYSFETQEKNASIFKMFVDYPEMQTLTIINDEGKQHLYVSKDDLNRFREAVAQRQDRVTLQVYNTVKGRFEERTIELNELNILDDQSESVDEKNPFRYAELLHTVFSHEELLGAGFMISRIIKERRLNPVSRMSYDRLWEILGEFNGRISAETDPAEQTVLLADMEVEINQLYVMGPMAYKIFRTIKKALNDGIAKFLGEAWHILPSDKREVYLNQQAHSVLPAITAASDNQITAAFETDGEQAIYSVATEDIQDYFEDENVSIIPGNTIGIEIPIAEFFIP